MAPPELDLNARPPCYGLGTLETLPLEVVHLTLIQLDMQSLIDFRRVNRRARQVADSVPQFRHILAQVPASIRASLGLETARYFSCQELYQTLGTAECESCGDFGGYLYLLTCRRVCFLCFTEKPDYLPLSRKDVIRKFGLGSAHIALLPRMRSLPRCYSPREI
ncbi:F-box protein, partial [Aspergillus niger CBS 101883]